MNILTFFNAINKTKMFIAMLSGIISDANKTVLKTSTISRSITNTFKQLSDIDSQKSLTIKINSQI